MWLLSRAMPADAEATEAAERTDPERGQKLRRGRPSLTEVGTRLATKVAAEMAKPGSVWT